MKVDSIQILGPFQTGTHLTAKIIRKIVGNNYCAEDGSTLIWKHNTNTKNILEKTIKENTNTLFICVYKPVYNWIESLKRQSYNISWSKNIIDPCIFKWGKGNYENVVELYNEYYLNYKDLIENNNNVLWVDCYSLLTNQNYIINKLKQYSVPIRHTDYTDVLQHTAKEHGRPAKNSEEALLRKKKADEQYENSKDKKFIQKNLDKSIITFFKI